MKHLNENQLIAYLFRLLSEKNSRRVRQHLNLCSRCSADLEKLRARFAMLDKAGSEPTLDSELIDKAIAALPNTKRPRPYLGYFSALAAAAVLFITISLIFFYSPAQPPGTPQMAFEVPEDVDQAKAESTRVPARESKPSVTGGLGSADRILPDSIYGHESFSLSAMPVQSQPYVEAFARAFTDPDIVIGVFESPTIDESVSMRGRQVRSVNAAGLVRSVNAAGLVRLKLSETIQGPLSDEILVSGISILPEQSETAGLGVLPDSRWILILEQTTDQAGDTEQAKEYGLVKESGSLCLDWPEEFAKPHGVVQVSSEVIADFKIIAEAVTEMAEHKPGAERIKTIADSLQTDEARAIFEKIVSGHSFE